jgi:Domain of unknown function (DUF1848)
LADGRLETGARRTTSTGAGEVSVVIVSASYRTDIPAFYADWFVARLDAGYVRVVNPYGGPPGRVPLTRDTVDGFVFWTRNLAPFEAALKVVAARGFPFVVQFTVTGYPRALDAATIAPDHAVAQVRAAADAYGPASVVWRYDPIVLSSLTDADLHRRRFQTLARALSGAVDEVVVSFLHVYRKTARNLNAAARAHGFTWRAAETDETAPLLDDLAAIAAANGLTLTLCGQPALKRDGVREARCIDAGRLSRVAGRPIDAEPKPHRSTCACARSRDIGAYDSCPHGCVYCYAVASRPAAKRRFSGHDPEGEFLIPPAAKTAAVDA